MTVALVCAALLILAGAILRQRVALLNWLHLPASVVGGLLGLLTLNTLWWVGESRDAWSVDLVSHWQSWPGPLIAVVFAGMLLAGRPTRLGRDLTAAGREGLMVWVIILGQTAVGLLVTWLWIQPVWDLPDAFGMLIETGFAGGHATAAAMGAVFESDAVGLESGRDLGILMATFGLVVGIVLGVLWVNVGIRRGWLASVDQPNPDAVKHAPAAGTSAKPTSPIHRSPRQTGLALDPLLLQMVWLAIALGVGLLLQWCVVAGAEWIDPIPAPSASPDQLGQRTELTTVVESFPLFIFTLFGGLIVRTALLKLGCGSWIDPLLIQRLTSIAMDVLVVAAVASLNLQAVGARMGPLLVLALAGVAWSSFCLLLLSRWILPREHWFELGLINFGMSTGTTATGFVLLRMIDSRLESGAAEDYALAAPLSSPFIGGGMFTFALPLLILGQYSIATVAILLSLLVIALVIVGVFTARRLDSTDT